MPRGNGARRRRHRRQKAARRCQAKRCWDTGQDAARFSEWLARVHDEHKYPYQCEVCAQWHLSSIPLDRWEQLAGIRSRLADTAADQQHAAPAADTVETTLQEASMSIIPVPQRDPDGPALQICGGCGQALPNHLSVCPLLPQATPSAATVEAVNDEEKKLGEAV